MAARLRGAALVLVAAGLSAPATGADAAPPSCLGHRATIVGNASEGVTGTPRRDVIVTNGARWTTTGDGDDLVCVTGDRRSVEVDVGDGDDRVRVMTRKSQVHFRSGFGSDVFTGGPRFDSVNVRADGNDVVKTRGGTDIVDVLAGPGERRPSVSLGPGDDTLWLSLSGTDSPRPFDGGRGRDVVYFVHSSKSTWTIDNRKGRASTRRETRLRWRGLEVFDLTFLRVPGVRFKGSEASESFYSQDLKRKPKRYAIDMGGGDDDAHVSSRSEGSINGGGGMNTVSFGVNYPDGLDALTADLQTETATVSYGAEELHWTLAGVQALSASDFPQITLRGDDAANILVARGCTTSLVGRGGSDRLEAPSGACDEVGKSATVNILGGEGDDSMLGGPGDDQLDGEGGADIANGQAGTDTCHAETRNNCELP